MRARVTLEVPFFLRRDVGIITSRRRNCYVGTQELLRRDAGKKGIGRGKGQKVKSHIWEKWKSESEKVILVNDKIEKVNEVNGEFGECTEKI